MKTLGLVTMTGGRPEAFALCEKWMSRQTRLPDQWVVVDDVEKPTKTTWGQEVLRPTPYWEPGQRTLNRNLLWGLDAIRTDYVAIIEDDDYYHPEWLETVCRHLDQVEMMGEGFTLYYNVQVRCWNQNTNNEHASLCATGFRSNLCSPIQTLLERLPPKSPFVDHPIWMAYGRQGTILSTDKVIGIKGLPGRTGCGTGHNRENAEGWPHSDHRLFYLRSLIGDDADHYAGFQGIPASNAMPPNMRTQT